MRSSPLFLFLSLLPTVLRADEVFIKGAGSVSGRIVDQNATQVVVDVGGGVVGVPMTRVERIVKAHTALDEYDERARVLASRDIDGWRALARWASMRGLEGQARQACERILAIDANDPEANGVLGFVVLDGQWVTREEAWRARGFVKFDGEWMLPAEAQLRLDQAAAERADREAAERTRAEELDKLKAEVQAQYAAEAAADEEWRAEGAAWFYSHAYSWCGWDCRLTPWSGASWSHGRSWHRR
jgi:hypothetical protein